MRNELSAQIVRFLSLPFPCETPQTASVQSEPLPIEARSSCVGLQKM